MSLLNNLSTSNLVKFIKTYPERLPPFVDANLKASWQNLITIFTDDSLYQELAKNPAWESRVNMLSSMLQKITDQELDVIRVQYLEAYNKYMKQQEGAVNKTLRYLIYKYGFESYMNDLILEQREDPKFKNNLPGANMRFYPGNPYLYLSSTYGPDETQIYFVKDYRIETLMDCVICENDFETVFCKNPAFGNLKMVFANTKIEKEQILYVILKAYNEQYIYDRKHDDEAENSSDEDNE